MTDDLGDIDPLTLGVMRKRARLQAIRRLQEAYEAANSRYGLNRKQFAKRIGMKPTEFSRILNGQQNITFETAEAVLRALNHRLSISAQDLDSLEVANSNRISRSENSAAAPFSIVLDTQPERTTSKKAANIRLDLNAS